MTMCRAFPIAAGMGGCAAFALRLIQNRTGFEADTGLPIPYNPAALALLIFLAALCGAIAAYSPRLPKDNAPAFPFRTDNPVTLIPCIAGGILLALSGAADVLAGLFRKIPAPVSELDSVAVLGGGVQTVCGILVLFSAAGILYAAASRRTSGAFRGEFLLMPPVALVVRLVVVYRVDSIDPVLEHYAVELLALAFLVLGFYSLSAFPFGGGNLRRFSCYAAAAIVLSLCAMADATEYLSAPLLYAGGALSLAGFLFLGLRAA